MAFVAVIAQAIAVATAVIANVKGKRAFPVDSIVFVMGLGLYMYTLAPTVLPSNSGEFQFVADILGIAHPPGYPLYTMLGKLFTLIPLGDVAYRVNLMSAFFAALTLALVSRTVRRHGGRFGSGHFHYLLGAGYYCQHPKPDCVFHCPHAVRAR